MAASDLESHAREARRLHRNMEPLTVTIQRATGEPEEVADFLDYLIERGLNPDPRDSWGDLALMLMDSDPDIVSVSDGWDFIEVSSAD